MTNIQNKLIIALDVENAEKALSLVQNLKSLVKTFKVGAQLFTSTGPGIINAIKKENCQIFLDLKYHDIPNTVAQAAREATKLGVYMFTIHTSGGQEMMRAAKQAVTDISSELKIPPPLLIGVTILTSIDETILREDLAVQRDLKAQVLHLANLAQNAGLDGVVCSPKEIKPIKAICGPQFLTVVPGIRPTWAAPDDQKRVLTPGEALKLGADYLVIGRPITTAPNPIEAAKKIISEV